MSEETDNPESLATAPVRGTLRERVRASAGWLAFGCFLLLALGGLLVTLCSRPLQITTPPVFERTVPRKIVPAPQVQLRWQDRERVGSSLQTPAKSLPQTPFPAHETAVAAAPHVTQAVTPPMPAPRPLQPPADMRAARFPHPVIAIVIDDMGLDRRRSAQIAALPAPVTLAYMPYARQVAQQTAQARAGGHELIVHMPMEPDDLARNNPGPDALLVKNAEPENMRRLDKNLRAFDFYMGVNNHMGSALTADRAAITPVLQDLKKRGLWFLDSKTNPRSVASGVAADIGLPFAARDVFLDNVDSRAAVLQQLYVAENLARRKGYAVAIGHPKDGTVAALKDWMRNVPQRGVTLVSLSTIIAARFPNSAVPRYAKLSTATIASQ